MRSWIFAGCIAIAVLGSASLGAVAVGARGAALGLVAVLGVAGIGFLVTLAMKCDAAKKAEALASGRQKDEERRRERASTLAFIDSVPHAVAMLLPDGKVELANSRAATFGLEPGKGIDRVEAGWLRDLFKQAITTRDRAAPAPGAGYVQRFEEGRETFFMPTAIPLINGTGEIDAVTVVLVDVTAARHAHEAKSSFMSSFSHELKTPMTSLQMSIYLLLDDAADRLTPRQLDLLKAAREDADRLHRLMEEVLAAARKGGKE